MNPPVQQLGVEIDPAKRLRQKWGSNIASTRELRGRSRAELAEFVGVTEAAVGMWERGETSPRAHIQIRVAEFLQAPHGVLFPMEAATP